MASGKGGPVFAFVHVPHTVPHTAPHSGSGSWYEGLVNSTSMVDCGAKDSDAVLHAHIEQGCNFVSTQRPLWRLRSRIVSALDDDERGTSSAVRLLSMAFFREPVSRGLATWQHYTKMASESAPVSAVASTPAQWQAGSWRAKLPTPVSRFGLGALRNRSLCGAQGSLCWGDACGDLKLSSRGVLLPQPLAAEAGRGTQAAALGEHDGRGGQGLGERGEQSLDQASMDHASMEQCPSGPVFGNLQTFYFADRDAPRLEPTRPAPPRRRTAPNRRTAALRHRLAEPHPSPARAAEEGPTSPQALATARKRLSQLHFIGLAEHMEVRSQ